MRYFVILLSMIMFLLGGCSSTSKSEKSAQAVDTVAEAPVKFDADSAYGYVQRQCDFGARVPGTEAHRLCGDYLVAKLKGFGANVIEQTGKVTTFDGVKLDLRNIIAQVNPDAERRILLLAHWDCRPWADKDPDKDKRRQPVLGANDAASGVAVLLEMARAMQQEKPNIGVDLMLVDVEDWGDDEGDDPDSWALGTQYWARNMHEQGYKPMYGILLDMVGTAGASFLQEYYSTSYAPAVVREVWRIAGALGHGNHFIDQPGGGINDDHLPVNKAGIPCIDIIDMRMGSEYGFFEGWHTTDDTMRHIDRNTLYAVGHTLLTLIYSY
ncbi:MAG: M28 family peptidase [Muribaculaceae bacterium]